MWLTEASGFCCYLWKYGNINFTEKIELPSHNCSGLSSLLNKVNCEADMRRDWHSLEWQCEPQGGDRRRSTPDQQPWSSGGGDLTRPDHNNHEEPRSSRISHPAVSPFLHAECPVRWAMTGPSPPSPQSSLSVCLKSSNKSQHEPCTAQPGTACSLYGKFLYCWQHPPARDLQVAFKFSSRL